MTSIVTLIVNEENKPTIDLEWVYDKLKQLTKSLTELTKLVL